MKKRVIITKIVAFILIFSVLFSGATEVMKRKTIGGPWNFSVKTGGFYNLEENSLDYMAFGSSHCYCSINPLVIWKETGLKGYLLTSQQQPVKATYYYIKEALKTQKPKAIILEGYMLGIDMTNPEEGVIRDAFEYFKMSKNKLDLINALCPDDNRIEYYISLFKYHSRWKELTVDDFRQDYKNQMDPYRGYVFLKEYEEQNKSVLSNTQEANLIQGENKEYLVKIQNLLKDKGIKLILYYAPFVTDENTIKNVNGVKEYAESNGIMFLNGFDQYEDLDFKFDFYDSGHVNYRGSEKLSSYLGCELKKFIPSERYADPAWDDAWQVYKDSIEAE